MNDQEILEQSKSFLQQILNTPDDTALHIVSQMAAMDKDIFSRHIFNFALEFKKYNSADKKKISKFICTIIVANKDRINALDRHFYAAIAYIALNLAQHQDPDDATTLLTELFKTWHKDASNTSLPACISLTEPREQQKQKKGTYGVVDISQHQAIKRIINDDVNSLYTFVVELFTLAFLKNHQNIINIQNFSLNPEFAIVMNNGGRTLSQYWRDKAKAKQTIPLKMQLNIMLQALKGVETMHKMDLYHRDLKGGNIFFDENLNHITIGDMGTVITKTQMQLNTIQALQIATTFCYAAIEVLIRELQCNNDHTGQIDNQTKLDLIEQYFEKFDDKKISDVPLYNESSDLYSIGRIWFEMAFASYPFSGNSNLYSVAYNIIKSGLQPCTQSEFSVKTSPTCAQVLFSLWDNDPSKRPPIRKVIEILEEEINQLCI